MSKSLFRIALIAAAAVLAMAQSVASANGRVAPVYSQESGPYHIEVGILPARAVVSKTHLSVLLRSLASREVITSASVEISAAGPPGSAAIGPLAAVNEPSSAFFEADLPFDAAGEWRVTVSVSSDLGETTALVPLQVQEGGGGINWILLLVVAAVILATGAFIWGRSPGRRLRKKGQNLR